MVRLFVRHSVDDYASWRNAYDDFDTVRAQLGVVDKAVYRTAGDPNNVTVTHDFESLDSAKAFADSDDLKAAMKAAGVTGGVEIWFGEPA
ncbi:MAG: cyclase [Thermomicrobiales bacterium]